MHVNHLDDYWLYGNIYISSASGLEYSLSLKNNVRGRDGQCDFIRIESLEGIYIANIYDEDIIRRYSRIKQKSINTN